MLERIALHVAADHEAIGPHIRPSPIPVQVTAVLVGAAEAVPVLAAAGRSGRDQARL